MKSMKEVRTARVKKIKKFSVDSDCRFHLFVEKKSLKPSFKNLEIKLEYILK